MDIDERRDLLHIVAYIKVKIAEAELDESDCMITDGDEYIERDYQDAGSRISILKDVLRELEDYSIEEI